MDSIEIIILLAFILFSLFGRSKKKKKRPAPAPQPAGKTEKQPSFFDEILRELEQQAQQGTHREPEPTPTSVEADIETSRDARRPVPQENPFAGEEAFEQSGRGHTPHEEHGFGSDSPFSEETFERLPLDPPPPLHEPGHLTETPHASLGKPLARQTTPQTSPSARRWRKRLQDPKNARDAIVLKEIFDRPRM